MRLKVFSVISGLLKPAGVLAAKSESQNIDSGKAFGKICIFHRSSIKMYF
jgi:hypothetical protein